jgi:hypothetical protein
MRETSFSRILGRRSFTRSLVAGTGIAVVIVAARSAVALTVQQLGPESAVSLDIAKRCGSVSEHAALLAELEAKLAQSDAAAGTTLTATATCPVCGCPVTATREIK